MNIVPIPFIWDGEVMWPKQRFDKLCAKQYVIGEEYRLGTIEERSHNSHSHFFASVNDAWNNLPERITNRFQTADHLRKFALIKTGFYDERSVVLQSRDEAIRVACFVRPLDEFSIVAVEGSIVRRFTPKSQSYRAMGKEEFQRSKSAVLEYLSDLIGIEQDILKSETGMAA